MGSSERAAEPGADGHATVGDVAIAVVAGAGALAVLDRAEAAALGRSAVYRPRSIAARLARRRLALELSPREVRLAGLLLRLGYASALGTAYACVRRLPARPVLRVAAFGAGTAGAELATMPVVGATPPPARWAPLERRMLLPHALTFAGVVELTLRWRGARRREAGREPRRALAAARSS